MKIHHPNIPPIGIHSKQPLQKNDAVSNKAISPFAKQLQKAVEQKENLVISKHAQIRLDQRNITISEEYWEKISNRVNEAKLKGVSESLVLLDNAALIVSAKNNTVITALDRKEATDQIFTNINGTIIIEH